MAGSATSSQRDTGEAVRTPGLTPPSISVTKGGGALRGIGEKFAANPVTGTGSMTIPLPLSPGRSGAGPTLSLSYDSGHGNGPFGLGWALSLPTITRKTDRGLPRYRDAEESDDFILAGAEDLVPRLIEVAPGRWERESAVRTVAGRDYRVQPFLPRVESLFARIERWTDLTSGEAHWRTISRDNVTTLYGRSAESRIADPADPTCIFSWLICETRDDRGNAIIYRYAAEDATGVDLASAHERNRTRGMREAGRLPKRILYGNRVSTLVEPNLANPDWMFEVVFDYGEHDPADPRPNDAGAWLCRHDPISSYRAGFEVRTYRLCQRVLVFHHFAGEPGCGRDTLVRSLDLAYRSVRGNAEDARRGHPVASFIASATQRGYVRRAGGGYLSRALPPVEFDYSEARVHDEVQTLDTESMEGLPAGVDGAASRWVDLDGEGISGVVTEQAEGWFYKRNLSPLSPGHARLGLVERLDERPAVALSAGRAQLMDLAGDGRLDVVLMTGPVRGLYERDTERSWAPFRAFDLSPNVDFGDPALRFVDLTGDGHADLLVTEDDVFTWYPSRAESGFGPAERVRQPRDEDRGPRLVFGDVREAIFLADMSGDGLVDLVRVRNGEVCYWPSLGYGRFGAKVTFDGSPVFDAPDRFDPRRIRLGDVDGSGTTDVFYLGDGGVTLWRNQSGNSWSAPHRLPALPIDDVASVDVVDLLGNGTACLVWSSSLPAVAGRQFRYIDLMREKPHLLVRLRNNLGAETRVRYAPATRFYLEDARAGRPWVTRLPFPVHVVEQVETFDGVSGNRFVTRYAYHHGYFDGVEREFRGFGLVEQWDTEDYDAFAAAGSANVDAASHVPPVMMRTWFHTGAYIDGGGISRQYEREYYREPGLTPPEQDALLLDDTALPAGLAGEEEREACRALRGSILREEIYALDRGVASAHPYSVSERSYEIRRLQPRAANRHAVFFVHAHETVNFQYERRADPRIAHSLVVSVDSYGNPRQTLAIAYGRRQADSDPLLEPADRAKQARTTVVYAERDYAGPVLGADTHRAPLPSVVRTWELTGFLPSPGAARFTIGDFVTWGPGGAALRYDSDVRYEDPPTGGRQRRLIEEERTIFRKDDLSGPLPLGTLESRAVPWEVYRLALTPGLLRAIFVDTGKVVPGDVVMLRDSGGYLDLDADGHWWIPSGRMRFSPVPAATAAEELNLARQHFFMPRRFIGPFGSSTTVTYDRHDLLVLETVDPVDNRITAGERLAAGGMTNANDYRVLQPTLVTDPNGNRMAAAFDALGLVAGTAAMGKVGEGKGDVLGPAFPADVPTALSEEYLRDPFTVQAGASAVDLLHTATTRFVYDLDVYRRTKAVRPDGREVGSPVVAALIRREVHVSDGGGGRLLRSFTYSDGFGREIQAKVRAEGDRWVCSGWVVLNNKGKPVKKYEPFFTANHAFELAHAVGVSPILAYDPPGRVVATLHPNHSFEKTRFDPWTKETWDLHDTLGIADPAADPDVGDSFRRLPAAEYLPTWRDARRGGALGPHEEEAADRAAVHADTPTIAYLDALGRVVVVAADAGRDASGVPRRYVTRTEYDIEGKPLAVVDALGNRTAEFQLRVPLAAGGERVVTGYDVNGTLLYHRSADAGARWILNDVTGKSIRAWDDRGHAIEAAYDSLRRPTDVYVRGLADHPAGARVLVQRTVYGEAQGAGANHCGRIHQQHDADGLTTQVAYDFKGNVLEMRREIARDYRGQLDWSAAPALDETFVASMRYDALDRPVQAVAPHHPVGQTPPTVAVVRPSVIRTLYNDAGLVEEIHVWRRAVAPAALLDPATADEHVLTAMTYDAMGRRTSTTHGNGVSTAYTYDRETMRLQRVVTTRSGGPVDERVVQDLTYTHDAAGNVTRLQDDADIHNVVFFDDQRVDPSADYQYDALYRLVRARGREHPGQGPPGQVDHHDGPREGLPHPGDGGAMTRYVEDYAYDAVGNIVEMRHQAGPTGWRRHFDYVAGTNRLRATSVPGQDPARPDLFAAHYEHDRHGNLVRMPHLPLMRWTFRDHLQATATQVVAAGTPETTHYVHGAGGQRVRKVTDLASPPGQAPRRLRERLTLGAFEIYREYDAAGVSTLERESLHVVHEGTRIALLETRTRGVDGSAARVTRYQYGNHLGSATLELDELARILDYEEYYPYGSTSYQAVNALVQVSRKRFRYAGKERDEETGLSHHGVRYYAPWLGRWTGCDPAGAADGTNLYRAARCNPVRLVDATGYGGVETTLTKPTVLGLLETKGLQAITELSFEVIDASGNVVTTGRFDVAFLDPRSQAVVLPELKGLDPNALTPHQQIYKPLFEAEGGATIRVTSARATPIGITKGATLVITADNYVVVTAKDLKSFAAALDELAPGALKHSYLDANGKMQFFRTAEEFADFLKTKGMSMNPTGPKGSALVPKSTGGGLGGGKPPPNAGFVEVGMLFMMLGVIMSGVSYYRGGYEIAQGKTGEGAVSIAEGSAGLFMTFAPYAKGVTAAAGTGAGALTFAAGVAAGGSMFLAGETARAAVRGEETPIDVADKYYGTGFGDIYGWSQRSWVGKVVAYSNPLGLAIVGANKALEAWESR